MTTYTIHNVVSSDNLPDLAQKYLGDSSFWPKIADFNNLRYPYISDDPIHQLSRAVSEWKLSAPFLKGSTSLSIPFSYTQNGTVPYDSLRKGNVLFIRKYLQSGDFKYDEIVIDSIEKISDSIVINFQSEMLENPAKSAYEQGLISVTATPRPANSVGANALAVETGILYVAYSHVSFSGKETEVSPLYEQYNSATNSWERAGHAFTTRTTINVTAPAIWPDGVQKIKVYIGYDPLILWYQFDLDSPSTMKSRTQLTLVDTGSNPPTLKNYSDNPKIGIQNDYQANSTISLHAEDVNVNTYVLKSGDSLNIPIGSSTAVSYVPVSPLMATSGFFSKYASDPYGTDIALGKNGTISFLGNLSTDLQTISSRDNVKQALKNKLSTKYGELSLFPQYGNRALNLVGRRFSPSLLGDIRIGLIETVYSDYRVSKITNISLSYLPETASVQINDLSIELSNKSSMIVFDTMTLS